MSINYQSLFDKLPNPEPTDSLLPNILLKINQQEKMATKKRAIIFSLSSTLSVILLFFAFKLFQTSLVESGFWRFFSLIFSDFSLVVAYGKNYLLTLLETLPVINLVVFLAVILIFLESIKFLAKNIKAFYFNNHLRNLNIN